MKRYSIVVLVVMLVVLAFSATALADDYQYEAETLHALGLFQGTDNGFELDRQPTRVEAAVMLVRLLGKEAAALAYTEGHPFTDVPAWADRHIAYLYGNELTKGTTETTFGSTALCNANMYITFVLRALGYNDAAGDFTYEKAAEFGLEAGLYVDKYVDMPAEQLFLRGDLAFISFQGLFAADAAGESMLIEKLLAEGAVEEKLANHFIDIYYNNLLTLIALLNTTQYDSLEYDEETSVSYQAEGYEKIKYQVETEFRGNLEEEKISLVETYTTAAGVEEYETYIDGDTVYLKLPSGEKFYFTVGDLDVDEDANAGSDTDVDENEDVSLDRGPDAPLYVFQSYSYFTAEESGKNITFTAVLSDAEIIYQAKQFLIDFDPGFDQENGIVTPLLGQQEYLVSEDLHLQKHTEVFGFSYVDADGITWEVALEYERKYKNIGETTKVKFPSFKDYEELSFEVARVGVERIADALKVPSRSQSALFAQRSVWE